MRTTIVNAKDLDPKDWRAEHYMPPTEEDLREAEIAGWKSGATGGILGKTAKKWTQHGCEEVRLAFEAGRKAGGEALSAAQARALAE